MKLPAERWLRIVLIASGLIFLGAAVYLYGFRFFDWVEPDAAVPPQLARRLLDAKLPVAANWYYANGDVWILAPHLFALIPVALFGVGPASLWLAAALGFVIELAIFAKLFAVLCKEPWLALFAATVTLMAWSNVHVKFEYIQLIYSCYATLWIIAFTAYARLANGERVATWRWIVIALFVALISTHNPVRSLTYVVAPLTVALAWLRIERRTRLVALGLLVAPWAVGYVTYTHVLPHVVEFSVPRGHIDFELAGASGIATNLHRLGEGIAMLCASGDGFGPRALPGILLLAGAVVFVTREAIAARTFTMLRLVSLAAIAQLVVVLVPLIVGNLLVDVGSIRYLLPPLVIVLGLAAILTVRTLSDTGRWRTAAIGWLVTVPITAAVGLVDLEPPVPEHYVWPDARETKLVADEIVRRGLTRGYSNVLTAGLMTVDAKDQALICPIYFRDYIMPERWLTDPLCYRSDRFPDKFFVVADQTDHDRHAITATLPAPIDKFQVGPTYEVYVYRTSDTSPAWLDLPLPDNDKSAFPLHIASTHLQLKHGKVAVEGGRMVATGETGTVLYGPYITLPRGRYQVTWIGNGLPSPGEIKFFVVANGETKLVEKSSLASSLPQTKGELVNLSFKLEAPRDQIEFSVYSQDGGRVALDELVVTRR